MGFVDALDRTQRKRTVLGFPIATFYKFIDDQGPYLSAIISFYALLAIFPILLLVTSVLGFILQGNPDLQERLINSALGTFPIIGDEASGARTGCRARRWRRWSGSSRRRTARSGWGRRCRTR